MRSAEGLSGFEIAKVFLTSSANRVLSCAESMVRPRFPEATLPKQTAKVRWGRESHFVAIQLRTFRHDSFACPPPHPTCPLVSKARCLVGSAAAEARYPPNLRGSPALCRTFARMLEDFPELQEEVNPLCINVEGESKAGELNEALEG